MINNSDNDKVFQEMISINSNLQKYLNLAPNLKNKLKHKSSSTVKSLPVETSEGLKE